MSELKKRIRKKSAAKPGKAGGEKYFLRLFVSGVLQNSVRAIKNVNQICEQYLEGNFKLEIIDVYQQPALAISEQVIVVPVMIIKHPLPEKRIIGDLSDVKKVLEILNCG